jgi:hypothetical protein
MLFLPSIAASTCASSDVGVVADHAAAEREHHRAAVGAGGEEAVPQRAEDAQRLRLLAGRDEDGVAGVARLGHDRLDPLEPEGGDVAVGDDDDLAGRGKGLDEARTEARELAASDVQAALGARRRREREFGHRAGEDSDARCGSRVE